MTVQQDLQQKNIPLIMLGLMLSLLLSALDNSIVSTAMPKITGSLNGLPYYSLPFTAYLLFSTVVMPIAGKLSDVFGRRLIILWGITLFVLTSIMCGLSANMLMLTVSRGLQGACAGVLSSSAFIITSEIFPLEKRGKYVGILASMHGLASVLGPAVGGLISDYVSWRWIFFINIPIGLLAFYLIKSYLPHLIYQNTKTSKRLDTKGIVVFLLAVFPFLLCFAEGGKHIPWTSPWMAALITLSAILLWWFIRLERHSEAPLLPNGLLKNDTFRKSALAASMSYMAVFGLIMYIPYLLQIVLKKGATVSGMIMIPMSIAIVSGGIVGGMLISRHQRFRMMGTINFTIAIAGMLAIALIGQGISTVALGVSALLVGLGIGLNYPVINIAPQVVFPPAQLGIVISSLEFFKIMGGVVSSSILGNLLHRTLGGTIAACIAALALGMLSVMLLDERTIREGFNKKQTPKEKASKPHLDTLQKAPVNE